MPYWGDDWYEIIIKTTKQSIALPVNPTEVTIGLEGEQSTYNLIGIGEVIIPRRRKLINLSISSFFPRMEYLPLSVHEYWYKPQDYVKFFTSLLTNCTVFKVSINKYEETTGYDGSEFNAIIKSFSTTDKGGEPGDIYYSLELSEYRDTAPQSVEKISENEETSVLTVKTNRTVPEDEFCVGDPVIINGPVYETDDSPEITEEKERREKVSKLNHVNAQITRVLPPSLLPGYDRVFCQGLGWVSKSSCTKNNIQNTIERNANFVR